ncbi:cell wall-binding repeat-containing protein [Fictibacillus norfolkensis]|uniref:Cell wall-binding repeat-containing protein n=1 Tax=Fictibacillus norfolkensis TaxID=2762233 RepID=A0ABR8SI69_9BACL|nr:cell wall-binding repeat-containing protein [Fictibacillus norfolkensis]MBD7963190.1 cell wall-binding repeat-containing protein [Fictibacillus norfolkensis]
MFKKFCVLIFLFLLVFSNSAVSANGTVTVERLSGADRFDVAVNVSKKGWTSGSGTVLLVNYKAFADALAASPLAYKVNAPILLTNPDRLNAKTEAEIKRLNASKVIIIGGTGSINQNVATKLSSLNLSVERIGGIDRYEVAYNVSKKLGAAGKVIISNGTTFADALSISPYASKHEYPILLTGKDKLPSYTLKAIQEKKPQQSIIVGGTGSISSTVEKQLTNPLRLGGKDRFEVAVNIAKRFNPSSTKAAISNGTTFADALTGSVLAAKQNMPLLLTQANSIPAVTKNYIDQSVITSFIIFGGTGSVSNSVVSQLKGELSLTGKRIILDAGHGGTDPGAVNGSIYEKNLNMSFTKLLATHLKGLGAEIIYTREPSNDKYISLEDRAAFANSKNADLLISIHHDSSVDKSATGQSIHYSSYRPGIETNDVYAKYAGKTYPFVREDTERKLFYYKDGSTIKSMSYQGDIIAYDTISPSAAATESKNLSPVASNAIKYNGIGTGYIKDHNLYVTRWTTMPSILIELGYMSNTKELSYLKQSSVQNSRSLSLAKAIENFYR